MPFRHTGWPCSWWVGRWPRLRLRPLNNDTPATEGLQGAQATRQVEKPRRRLARNWDSRCFIDDARPFWIAYSETGDPTPASPATFHRRGSLCTLRLNLARQHYVRVESSSPASVPANANEIL